MVNSTLGGTSSGIILQQESGRIRLAFEAATVITPGAACWLTSSGTLTTTADDYFIGYAFTGAAVGEKATVDTNFMMVVRGVVDTGESTVIAAPVKEVPADTITNKRPTYAAADAPADVAVGVALEAGAAGDQVQVGLFFVPLIIPAP